MKKIISNLDLSNGVGQVLAELLIAIAVIVVFVTFGAQLVSVSLQGTKSTEEQGQSLRLAQEALEAIRAIAYGNDPDTQGWNRIYLPTKGDGNATTDKGPGNSYYPIISTSTPAVWTLFRGTETITLEGKTYTRKVIIDNVSRDGSGNIETVYNSANDDPATQKVTIIISKSGAPDTTLIEFFTRFFNDSGPQSDWSAAANCGPVAATSSPTIPCTLTCTTGSSTVGSIRLLTSC